MSVLTWLAATVEWESQLLRDTNWTCSSGSLTHVPSWGLHSRLPPTYPRDVLFTFRYLQYREQKGPGVISDGKKVISMTLYGKDPKYSMGIMRNAQMLPVFMPGWTLRVYVAHPNSSEPDLAIPPRIMHKLGTLGVQLAFLDPTKVTVPPSMWNMLVADDLEVDHFIVRNATHRFSDREATVINFWLQTGFSFLSIKDHPNHTQVAVVSGLWGARPRDLLQLLGDPIYLTLQKGLAGEASKQEASTSGSVLRNSAQNILVKYIWPLVQPRTLILDSVSCDKSTTSFPFPSKRSGGEYVGQAFDEHQVPLVVPSKSISSPDACTKADLKPSDLPALPALPKIKVLQPGTVRTTPVVAVMGSNELSDDAVPPINATATLSVQQNETAVQVPGSGPGVNVATTQVPSVASGEKLSNASQSQQ